MPDPHGVAIGSDGKILPVGTLQRLDDRLGERLERAVVRHHRHRLSRAGWLHALDAPAGRWANGAPEPRGGNSVEILVDGEAALPAIAAAIRSAESHVHLAGWHFSPDFQLEVRGQPLRELLAEAAERVPVRVLAWAGSPLPLFRPDRTLTREALEALTGGTRIRSGLDAKERPMHCHHEKLVVVDDRLAHVGGIDLSLLGGDRYDRSDHPARGAIGWHDATARLAGPAVADVAAHFALRWQETTGERLPHSPEPERAGDTTVQVVRTVPENVYDRLPKGDFRLLEAYLGALRGAERFIYLENQFLWSPEVVAVLVGKLRHPPSDDFRVVVMLPARPNNGQDDTRGQLALLVGADRGDRFLACTLYQRGTRPPCTVYVHAKIGIVDDRWLTIGSANLNEHSLFNDTEMNLVVGDDDLARAARKRLWSEHLECTEGELDAPVHEIVDRRWRPIAEAQVSAVERGEALERRLSLLPHVSWRSGRLLGPLNGLLVDG